MAKRRAEPKAEELRRLRCLNPKPETVRDSLFLSNPFFDARDMLQVKYEMLRRVSEDGGTVSAVAADFGVSRPTWYQAQRACEAGGLPGLMPERPGPRTASKLGSEVVEAMEEARRADPGATTGDLVRLVQERFGLTVHRRSVERALARKKKL